MNIKSILRNTFSVFFVALCIVQAGAQYLETGLFLGAANYRGDMADRLFPNEYKGAYGMTMRYNFSPKLSAKANLLNAYIAGSDQNARGNVEMQLRNLSFRTDIVELSVQGEYSPLGYDVLDGKVSTPYVFAGIAGMYFNPQAELNGIWYDLQPMATEGVSYSRFAFAIPMGVGFRFALGRRVNLGLEFGARYAFTDYLDDVSGMYPDVDKLLEINPTAARLSFRGLEDDMENPMGAMRGNPKNNDLYFIGGLSISVNLTDQYGMEWNKKYRIYDEKK